MQEDTKLQTTVDPEIDAALRTLEAAEESRCWVFGSSKPISAGSPVLNQRLNKFFTQWQSHGEAVSGRWRVLFDRFLVILREPDGAQVSGCSIDSMVGEIKLLEKELDTSLLDSSRIFYKSESGSVEAVTRAEFKALAAADKINLDTQVYDTTLTLLSDLQVGVFSKSIRDSWHVKIFEQGVKSAIV